MDSNNPAAHLADRAYKHERQAEAKKHFADDFCFHVICFLSCLGFFDWLSPVYTGNKRRSFEIICSTINRPAFTELGLGRHELTRNYEGRNELSKTAVLRIQKTEDQGERLAETANPPMPSRLRVKTTASHGLRRDRLPAFA
jgi:hypothetical protein